MNLRNLLVGLRRSLVVVIVLAAMTLLVMALSGFFGEKTPATTTPTSAVRTLPPGVATLTLAMEQVPIREEAVGTIRAVQEIQVASRILGRVREMHVAAAGQRVQEGEVLVELEDSDLRARLLEAEAAQRSAVETMQQAERDLARTRELFEKQIASARDLERDQSRFENVSADVDASKQAVAASRTALDYAVIRSPIDGVVIDKQREKGDTIVPGDVLMTLYDPSRMQLVASVREQLATRLRVGEEVGVAVDALGLQCHGTVSEIVPLAAAGSRAFDVKVSGPCPEGVFTGMFGRLVVELGTRGELRIPQTAVRAFGQVDQVFTVGEGDRLLRRFVVLGDVSGDRVTVMSGLHAGERIVVDAAAVREAAGR